MCEDTGPRPQLIGVLTKSLSSPLQLSAMDASTPTLALTAEPAANQGRPAETQQALRRCPVTIIERAEGHDGWIDITLEPPTPTSWRTMGTMPHGHSIQIVGDADTVQLDIQTLARVGAPTATDSTGVVLGGFDVLVGSSGNGRPLRLRIRAAAH